MGCGVLVIAQLTPILFGGLGYNQTTQLGLSAVWVFVSGIGSTINAFLLDRFGRRTLLRESHSNEPTCVSFGLTETVIGGSSTAAILITEAVLQKYYLGTTYAPGLNAAAAMFFIYVFIWASTVDNTAIVYIPEIWPTHLRSYGSSIAYCSYYVVAIATVSPASLAFSAIGYKYYFVFLSMCILSLIYIYFEFPEVRCPLCNHHLDLLTSHRQLI